MLSHLHEKWCVIERSQLHLSSFHGLQAQYNDTSELEASVTILEEEVEELETSDSQQNDRLNNMDTDISDNENDIEGTVLLSLQITWCYIIFCPGWKEQAFYFRVGK